MAGPSNSNNTINNSDIPDVLAIENADEIAVVKKSEDPGATSPPKNVVFPSDIEQNTVNTTEAYKDSKECKSIIKSVTITFIVIISIPIFFFFAHRTINPHNGSKIADIIILITYTIIWKLFRSLFVIISSIYCFEVIGTLFSTMVSDIIESIQRAYDRSII